AHVTTSDLPHTCSAASYARHQNRRLSGPPLCPSVSCRPDRLVLVCTEFSTVPWLASPGGWRTAQRHRGPEQVSVTGRRSISPYRRDFDSDQRYGVRAESRGTL